MKISLSYRGKKIIIDDIKKCNSFEKFVGLMFKRREKAQALLFEFNKLGKIAIHSLFVFFPFVAIWIDDKGKIVEIRKVMPWKVSIKPKKEFVKLVEIPLNKRYKEIVEFLDDTERFK